MGSLRKLVNLGIDLVIDTLSRRLEEELDQDEDDNLDPPDPDLELVHLFDGEGTVEGSWTTLLQGGDPFEEMDIEIEDDVSNTRVSAAHPTVKEPGFGRVFWVNFSLVGASGPFGKIFQVTAAPSEAPADPDTTPEEEPAVPEDPPAATPDEVHDIVAEVANIVGQPEPTAPEPDATGDAQVDPSGPFTGQPLELVLQIDQGVFREAGVGEAGLLLSKIRAVADLHPDLLHAFELFERDKDRERLGGINQKNRYRKPSVHVSLVKVGSEIPRDHNTTELVDLLRSGDERVFSKKLPVRLDEEVRATVTVYHSVPNEVLASVHPSIRTLTVSVSAGFVKAPGFVRAR